MFLRIISKCGRECVCGVVGGGRIFAPLNLNSFAFHDENAKLCFLKKKKTTTRNIIFFVHSGSSSGHKMKSKLYFSAMPYTRTAGQLVKAVGSLKLSSEKCLRFNLLPN